MTRIILTRHGQTEWNRNERFRGRADVALNETGIRQAELTSQRIHKTWQPKVIYTSPLSRAVKTGEIIARPYGLAVQPLPNLNDIDYGDWQGLSPDEVRTRWGEALDMWYRAPHLAQIPHGETLAVLFARASDALSEIVRQHASDEVVIVGHDSVNRTLLLFMLGLPLARYWHLSQDTCAINLIEADNDDFTVISINETFHLALDI